MDKLNLIKADKRLIYNFKFDEIKIQLNLNYLLIIDNDLSYLTGIHKINLTSCKQITDQSLQYLADKSALTSGKLKGVHTIDLSYCNQITDQCLQYCEGVRVIKLMSCYKITDQGLQYLAVDISALTSGKLKGVHTINLYGCIQLTGQGLQYLTDKSTLNSNKLKRSSHHFYMVILQ